MPKARPSTRVPPTMVDIVYEGLRTLWVTDHKHPQVAKYDREAVMDLLHSALDPTGHPLAESRHIARLRRRGVVPRTTTRDYPFIPNTIRMIVLASLTYDTDRQKWGLSHPGALSGSL